MNTDLTKKSCFSLLLRLVVSGLLLAVAYTSVDINSLIDTFKMLSPKTAILLGIMYTTGQVFSALKWRKIVDGAGIKRGPAEIIRAYFFGMFVNTFALGTVGGDVARSLALKPESGRRTIALATAVADRVHGLLVLIAIGAISSLFLHPRGPAEMIALVAGPILIVLCLGLWLGPRAVAHLLRNSKRFGPHAQQIAAAFPNRFRTVMTISSMSLVVHILQISMHYFITSELNANITLAYLFAVVPMVNVASSLPLSINGLGIREGMYILLFTPLGISRETAVAFGAIWILIVTAVSALGGIIVSINNKIEFAKELRAVADEKSMVA
ncbi:MAG: flippase-like domain-containing protein [Deltaproteobacteria bacterium]|nr:flippase-like domain-containing protein [Deltaproteobacteria bacterium]